VKIQGILFTACALLANSGVCRAAGAKLPAANPKPAETAFYVATNGNDGWSGKLAEPNQNRTDGPFASVARARNAVRAVVERAKGSVMVYIRGGRYHLTEPLVFTPQDSGSSDSPVTYAAYSGEIPVLSGGRIIAGWKQDADGLWTAQVGTDWNFHQLFVNGQRRPRARLPATGFFRTDGEIPQGQNARFRFHPGDIRPAWARLGNVEVVAIDKWMDLRMTITSVEGNTVTTDGDRPADFDNTDVRYWIENVPEALAVPGMWYLDRRTGVVSYRALAGEDLSQAEVMAPALEQVIRFDGSRGGAVHDLGLRGLTVSHADWAPAKPAQGGTIQADAQRGAALEATGAQSITVEKCTFTHLGQYAVAFGQGAKRIRIVANEMADLGAGGVKIGDAHSNVNPKISPQRGAERSMYRWPTDPSQYRAGRDYPRDEAATSSDNLVTNNRIHDLGAVFPAAVGIWVGQSPGNTIAHNEIHDTYYSGISCGWTWGFGPTAARNNVIEYNLIYNIGRGLLSDMGAIYLLGVQPGTVVRNNVVHDVARFPEPDGYGGWGVYLDATTSGVMVANNLIYRTQDGALHQNSGENNTIVNNIFALGEEAQIFRSHAAARLGFTFEHNIVYWRQGDLLRMRLGEGGVMFDSNLYYNAGGGPVTFGAARLGTVSWQQWQARGQDKNSLIADPGFADPEHGDFSLRPDSPASKIGFKPIDVSQAGARG
jgi:hypothetical protein